ncbi:MAG: thioredoxin [Marinilabiliales bacterium]|nr:MAG: thioredoxin [Marinilabiliales bacterium]
MKEIYSLAEIKEVIETEKIVLFYFTGENCNVCKSLRPKVLESLQKMPEIKSYLVNLEKSPAIAGHFTIFSIPGILVFVEGKESIRAIRNISVVELENKLQRYLMLF